MDRKRVSVVVSVYNEEKALGEFYAETLKVLLGLDWDYELVFVNDGSRDGSLEILKELAGENHRVKLVSFSRNFGHEAAMIAGLDYSTGDVIICMDADLQHPPECIPEILKKIEEGFHVITMVRTKNRSAGKIKNITSSGFYWVINHISDVHLEPNASDFFAVSSHAARVLRSNYREKVRFLRGYVQNIGFARTNLTYEARARVAGESKYSLKKLLTFSINTILCFSNMPFGPGGDDLHPFYQRRRAQRLRHHRGVDLLYVRHDVFPHWNHRGIYRNPFHRVKGSAGVYCGRDEESGQWPGPIII